MTVTPKFWRETEVFLRHRCVYIDRASNTESEKNIESGAICLGVEDFVSQKFDLVFFERAWNTVSNKMVESGDTTSGVCQKCQKIFFSKYLENGEA